MNRPRAIGIFGHYHGGNLGDEAIVAALISQIRARLPDAEIVGFSQGPSDTRERYGIRAYPIRQRAARPAARARKDRREGLGRGLYARMGALRAMVRMILREPLFLWRSWRTLRGIDLLVIAGSGPLTDEWGEWNHAYTVFKWAMLARASGTRFMPLCVGGGPLDSGLGKFFVRSALRVSSYRSYRDPSTARLVESLGVGAGDPVLPDLAFSLDVGAYKPPPADRLPGDRIVVGLNAMAHEDGRYVPIGDSARFGAYLEKMADFTEWLLRQGHQVVLIYSQARYDKIVAHDLLELLSHRPHAVALRDRLVHREIETLSDLIAGISACDYLVAARYHCILLPQLLAKPVIALAYHPKTFDLMASVGLSDYCVDIDRFRPEELIERFRELTRDRERIREELEERTRDARRALGAQYDRLFGAVR